MRGTEDENGPCLRCRVIRERYVEGSYCGQQLLASLRPGNMICIMADSG
jgi:hypothetical protein